MLAPLNGSFKGTVLIIDEKLELLDSLDKSTLLAAVVLCATVETLNKVPYMARLLSGNLLWLVVYSTANIFM